MPDYPITHKAKYNEGLPFLQNRKGSPFALDVLHNLLLASKTLFFGGTLLFAHNIALLEFSAIDQPKANGYNPRRKEDDRGDRLA